MPRIGDQEAPPSKTFKKKSYRPWNLLDELSTPLSEKTTTATIELDSQMDSNWIANRNELDSNQIPISKQIDTNQIPISNQSSTQKQPLDSNWVAIRDPIGKQLDSKKQEYKSSVDEINRLCGSERKLFFFVLERCLARGQLTSGPITNESLRILINSSNGGVKSTIHRLVSKGFLVRERGKTGRGGFSSFILSHPLRDAALEIYKQVENTSSLDSKWIAKQVAEAPSSSYIYNNKTTTTELTLEKEEKSVENFEDEGWSKIDIESLQSIGFHKTHLFQIAKQNLLTIEMVQDSIYAFAFDLEHNNKQATLKTTPLNYFMGILRNGRPYAPPANYESPQDVALRLYVERRRELETKRLEMEKAASDVAFQDWLQCLSEAEKQQILPASLRTFKAEQPKLSALRHYFISEVWVKQREEIVSSIS